MKTILFIHHTSGWGGSSKCLISLILNIDKSKYKPIVLLLKDSIISKKLEESGIDYVIVKSKFYKKYYQFFPHSEAGYIKKYRVFSLFKHILLWVLSRFYYAEKELQNYKYDLIHLNSSVLTDWLAPAKKTGKVIVHIREPLRRGNFDLLYYFFRWQYKKYADKIIAISNDNSNRVNLPHLTQVIYDYCENPQKLPSDNSYSSKIVLYLGGSSTSKGFYTLTKSLDYLDNDVKVHFAGNYVESKFSFNIKKTIKYIFSYAIKRNRAINKIKNHTNAKYIGLIYNVSEYLQNVACLVSPFKVPHFSFPVIEAHINRKPVIVSDVEGMDEIVINNENGIIVQRNNPKALALAINELTSNYNNAKQFGENGFIMAFKSSNIGYNTKINILYDKLIN